MSLSGNIVGISDDGAVVVGQVVKHRAADQKDLDFLQ